MKNHKILPLLVIALGVALVAKRHHRAHLKWRDPDDWDAW